MRMLLKDTGDTRVDNKCKTLRLLEADLNKACHLHMLSPMRGPNLYTSKEWLAVTICNWRIKRELGAD